MTANTKEAMDERAAFEAWAKREYPNVSTVRAPDGYAHSAAHRVLPATYASVQMLWDAYRAGCANLPLPQGDGTVKALTVADKVDAERFRFMESLGTVETRWRDAQEINFEWPRDTELSAAIDAAIAAGLTPGGQE